MIVDALAPDASEYLKNKVNTLYPAAEVWTQPIGPVIGAHCGPGTYGVIFTSKDIG